MSVALEELRRGVREVCARFPNEYWRKLDAERRYPEEFVGAMGEAGYLAALIQTFGGYGFDAAYDVERKFRETRLYQVAPISTNLILSYVAEHVLGLPRSF